MKNTKRKLVSKIVGGILCGVIGLTSFGGLSAEATDVSNKQATSSITVSEKEKQSEQLYRTKTGKCYHKGNCACLKKSKIKVNQEEIKEADLKPCSKCCK